MSHSALSLPIEFDVMIDRHGLIAADELVLAPESRVHHANTLFDGKPDGMVIARCEVQERRILKAAPIAAVEVIQFMVEESHGDSFA